MPKCNYNKVEVQFQLSCKATFIEIALWHGVSLVYLLHIFKTPFLKNTSGQPLLNFSGNYRKIHRESQNKK